MIPKLYTLPNGLRLVLVPMQDHTATSMLVLVDAGSFDEMAPAYGVAHFLEHMCFKGTPTYPASGAIARELEGLGAATNAFTGRHLTGYWAKVEPKRAHDVLSIVADLYLNPVFPEAEIEKERGVVLEELRMYEDHPKALAPDVYNILMYGDSAAGRPIVGYENTVTTLSKKDLDAFRAMYYHPERTVVAISGAFDPKKMLAQIKKLFGKAERGKVKTKAIKRAKPALLPERLRVRVKKSEQTHLVLGVPGLPTGHKDEHVLTILTNILGGGMSSRLFQRIREEMGAAYYVSASESMHPSYGDVTFHAGVPHAKVEEVVRVIKEECNNLIEKEVSAEELVRVKNYTIGHFMLTLESSDAVGEYYGSMLLESQPLLSPAARAKALRAVTAQDIKRLAKTLFKPDAFRLALVGPRTEEELNVL